MQPLMKATRILAPIALLVSLLVLPAPAAGQEAQASSAQMTTADVQRLEAAIYDANSALERLRSQNPERAEQLQARLDELREEVTYLKVKQRKKEGASRSEYGTLRDKIDDVRIEARNAMPGTERPAGELAPPSGGVYAPRGQDRPPSTTGGTRQPGAGTGTRDRAESDTEPARQGTTTRPNEIPAGTELDVRLEGPLSSETAQVEDRFTATTVADLYNGSRIMIPSGSSVRGVVTAVNKAGRVDRTGKLTLSFDRVTVNGRSYPLNGTVIEALQSGGYREDAGKIGAGAGVGAIIGGILGGLKGALAGILIGGGGVVAATEGKDVNLPAGTVLRIRLETPVTIK